MTEVIVLFNAGQIGQVTAWRVSAWKHLLLADVRRENAVSVNFQR